MKLLKIPIPVVLTFVLAWQVLLTFQGLDMADTGFHLSAYKYLFDDPYSVQYYMMYWLSAAGGHLWMGLMPPGGLLWARIGWVFFISISFLLYTSLLNKLFGSRNLIPGLAITLVFMLLGGPECLNYDVFTTTGFALALAALFRGLTESTKRWVLLSGFIFGISVFFKLSNLAGLLFGVAIPFWYILNCQKTSVILVNLSYWLGGYVVGVLLILWSIRLAGHWDLFFDNLKFVSSMGADVHSSHGLRPMVFSYLKGYVNALVMVSVFAGCVVVGSRYIRNRKTNFFLIYVFAGLSVFLLTAWLGDVFWSKIRYLFLGAMMTLGFIVLSERRAKVAVRLLVLLGMILLVIVPLGSDTGLEKSVWGMWILGPLLLSSGELWNSKAISGALDQSTQTMVRNLLAVAVFSAAVVHAWQTTYFDTGSRWAKTATVDHPELKMIFTSAKRAKVVEELIREGFPKIRGENYLLGFVEIPMVNYLSGKRPFISTSWPKLYYNPEKFREKLDEALAKRRVFPAIIRQKQNTMLNDWPGIADPKYLSYPEGLSKWPVHGRILNEFITKFGYRVVWENEMFQVLTRQ